MLYMYILYTNIQGLIMRSSLKNTKRFNGM